MKYLEDIVVGESSEHGAYELSADEVMAFARQYDPQPFHLDPEVAEASVFGGLTASGFHLVAIQGALVDSATRDSSGEPDIAAIAGLGLDEVRFTSPARVGDTLSLRLTCVEKRPSASKPDRGIVRFGIEILNQDRDVVLSSIQNVLVRRRPTSSIEGGAETTGSSGGGFDQP